MFVVKLTEQQKQNLLTFLGRVQLTGQEASAFMEIILAIQEAETSTVEKPVNK